MNLLALEFSSSRRSVAIVSAAGGQFRALASTAEDQTTSTSMELIHRTFVAAAISPSRIDQLVIGLGPGSYTGIRSAIALAQGWQLARETPILATSSIEVLAHEAQHLGCHGKIQFRVDAQRNEVYAATYQISDGGVRVLSPLQILPVNTPCDEILAGPQANRFSPGGRVIFPTAVVLAKVAFTHSTPVAGETLEPIYLRETTFVKAPPPRPPAS